MLAVLKWTRSEAEQAEGHLHSCYTDLFKQCSCQEKALCGGGNRSKQIKTNPIHQEEISTAVF